MSEPLSKQFGRGEMTLVDRSESLWKDERGSWNPDRGFGPIHFMSPIEDDEEEDLVDDDDDEDLDDYDDADDDDDDDEDLLDDDDEDDLDDDFDDDND